MFQETTSMKLQKNKNIIDSNFKIKLRDISRKFILLLAKSNIKYKIVKKNNLQKLKDHSTIYVVNHYSAQDTPIACNLTDDRAYILAGKQNLGFFDNLFFKLYGSIFVDRKDNADMALSKKAMEAYLNKGKSILMFPEGTWNLTDNLLILNMKWGIIDIARNTNSQIINIDLDYNREDHICTARYGNPILIGNDSKNIEEIRKLRDKMATLRLEAIKNKTIVKRDNIDIDKERLENRYSINEFPKIDMEYEESVIYQPYDTNEKVFEQIKSLKLSKNNAFLFYKNNKGMY